jgi:hypothetical protein
MTSPAQGLYKVTAFGKQVGLGTPLVGAGGQILRRKTSVFNATRDTTENDEITSHRMSTGLTYGQKKSSGKLDGNLSSGTYSKLMAGALMADFAAVTPYAAGTDVVAAVTTGNAGTFTDASAGYLTAGLKVGMVGRWTGWSSANNARNFWITSLTAGVMTGLMLDGSPVVADAGGVSDDVTFTVVGKVSKVPLTGHTNDFFTFEEWYSDISKSEVFPDCKVNQVQISLPAAGPASAAFDIVGLGTRTLGTAQSFTSPTAETTTDVVQALHGAIYANGAFVDHVTSCTVTLDRGITPIGASIGSNVSPDVNQGKIKVSGTFSAMFDNATLSALFDAETKVSLAVVSTASGAATADFVGITMGKVAFTGDAPDDGEKVITRTYPFTAEINGAGGTALAFDKTIVMIQDSQAA